MKLSGLNINWMKSEALTCASLRWITYNQALKSPMHDYSDHFVNFGCGSFVFVSIHALQVFTTYLQHPTLCSFKQLLKSLTDYNGFLLVSNSRLCCSAFCDYWRIIQYGQNRADGKTFDAHNKGKIALFTLLHTLNPWFYSLPRFGRSPESQLPPAFQYLIDPVLYIICIGQGEWNLRQQNWINLVIMLLI